MIGQGRKGLGGVAQALFEHLEAECKAAPGGQVQRTSQQLAGVVHAAPCVVRRKLVRLRQAGLLVVVPHHGHPCGHTYAIPVWTATQRASRIRAAFWSPGEQQVYAYLVAQTSVCWESYATLGRLLGLSPSTVWLAVDSLRTRGLAEIHPHKIPHTKGAGVRLTHPAAELAT